MPRQLGPFVAVKERPVHTTKFGIIEKTVRFPIDYPKKKAFFLKELETFKERYLSHACQIYVTGNLVLQGPPGPTAYYSIFYGQNFSPNIADKGYCIADIVSRGNAKLDVERLRFDITQTEAIAAFDKVRPFRPESGCSIVKVLDIVYVIRKVLGYPVSSPAAV